jgi:hypothetical protein
MKIATLRPNLKTVDIRPTKSNPDIKVVVGTDALGNYLPKEIHYPDHYSNDEIMEKVRAYNAGNKPCKVCQRYAAEQAGGNNTAGTVAILCLAIAVSAIIYMIIKKRND